MPDDKRSPDAIEDRLDLLLTNALTELRKGKVIETVMLLEESLKAAQMLPKKDG